MNNKEPLSHNNESSLEIAALIICYSRFESVVEQINVLKQCGIERIYISIDGPKSRKITEIQNRLNVKVLEIATANKLKIEVKKNERNLGLAKAVVSGIDWFFRHEESGLILEDDLVITQDTVKFMRMGLAKMDSVERLLLISANQFIPRSEKIRENSWISYPLIWGWATNRERWGIIKELIGTRKKFRNKKISLEVRSFWRAGKIRTEAGLVNSWAMPLAHAFHNEGYFSLCPPVNLSNNIGADGLGVHTTESSKWMRTPIDELPSIYSIPPLDFSDLQACNNFLEREVFGISRRHLLSPIKALLEVFFFRIYRKQSEKINE